MLTVTERAKVTLAQLKMQWMQSKIEDVDVGLRLSLEASAEASPGPGVFGLWADREAPGDHVVEYGGTKVLLVEEELAAALAEALCGIRDEGISLRLSDRPPRWDGR